MVALGLVMSCGSVYWIGVANGAKHYCICTPSWTFILQYIIHILYMYIIRVSRGGYMNVWGGGGTATTDIMLTFFGHPPLVWFIDKEEKMH